MARDRWTRMGRHLGLPGLLLAGVGLLVAAGRSGRQIVVYPEAEVAQVTHIHDYRGAPLCQACHVPGGRALNAAPDALCERCHSYPHGSHPVNVVQGAPMLYPLPLSGDRRVLCHTCHDPHDLRQHPKGLRLPFNDLCTSCHPGH